MSELLVDVPQMQRDLHRALDENAYLRAQIKKLKADDVISSPPRPRRSAKKATTKPNEDDADFDKALARRQRRLDAKNDNKEEKALKLELKSANDRVESLERLLLDAEETICHLKAEKLEALRNVERLSTAGFTRTTEQDKESRKLVLELERRLAEQKQSHSVEQEQRMAVIREQEKEMTMLKKDLEERTKAMEELQQRHLDLLELDGKAVKKRVASGVDQLSIIGEDSDNEADKDSEDETDKPKLKRTASRARASAMSALPKWQEELVRHPTPVFDMDSPEVNYLLKAWTSNRRKIQYLRRWLIQVTTTKGLLPGDFPMGVELPRLPPEVRDGFLTLVLPLLRKQTEREILAHSRRYNDGFHTDLRFRAVPRE